MSKNFNVADFMPNKNKVKLSYELFNSAFFLLKNLDVEDFEPDVVQLYGYVFHAFSIKKASVDQRISYSMSINSDASRHSYGCSDCVCHRCDNVPF